MTQAARAETVAHRALKQLAFVWARQNGMPLAACEVRIPSSGYRADVAACTALSRTHPDQRRCALFECKQSRADLLRDQANESAVRAQLAAASERMQALRALIACHRPDLRLGESLFPEFDDYDFRGLHHTGLHALEKELEALQHKILESVKFAKLRRWQAADHLYLVTEPDILSENEVPLGWGWLIRSQDQLELRLRPHRLAPTDQQRLRWVEAIASAGTRAAARDVGAPLGITRPGASGTQSTS